jgi:mono/diheme cytochrome c family protein
MAPESPHLRCDNAHAALPLHAAADRDLAGYSAGKSDSDYGSGVHLDAANAQQIAHGRKLIVELGCAACHEINGVQKPENFAPELSTIGSKPLAQIVFLPGMEHSLPSYIVAKIRQPRAFGASVKMPQFTLTASQTDALTTALLALTSRGRSMPDNLARCGNSRDELSACRARGQADHRTRLL